ncbi:MAG: N-acetyltransferase [Oscillospiraceae bacterium]|nr:N-acetyltransferase [Oscillospiraceae bacterium]
MTDEIGERQAKDALSDFSCGINRDVEYFLHEKSIEFAKQNISQTHLVMAPFEHKMVIAGYFALANKNIQINENSISNTLFKRILRFGKYEPELQMCSVSAPLIGQLGKNFKYSQYNLITGNELLKLACEKLRAVQEIIGGRVVYLECEDKQKLKDFYGSNGFIQFGKRSYDPGEERDQAGEYYLQFLKYMQPDNFGVT